MSRALAEADEMAGQERERERPVTCGTKDQRVAQGLVPGAGEVLEVYLLRSSPRRFWLYAEQPSIDDVEADGGVEPEPGLRSRIVRWYRCARKRAAGIDKETGPRMRRLWSWLRGFISLDERWLRHLRTADRLVFAYPAAVPERRARRSWERYLNARHRKHLRSLIINTSIAPVAVILMFVPGPNVIGYWFAYRAVCHLLVLLGVRRARRGDLPIEFRPVGLLDDISGADPARAAERLSRLVNVASPQDLTRLSRRPVRFFRPAKVAKG